MTSPIALILLADPDAEKLTTALVADAKKRIAPSVSGGISETWLGEGEAFQFTFNLRDEKILRTNIKLLLDGKPFDWAALPIEGRKKKLLISDMDSTMIEQECIDELADFAGLKSEVAAITERAMNGELDFAAALEYRVSLLKGLPVDVLEKTFSERITASKGARTLVHTMNANGANTLLVSGGFTFFTSRVGAMLGFAGDMANQLDIADGILTGNVIHPILDKESKLQALRSASDAMWLRPDESIAIGDGANDLPMIKAAGLGIAYRAKPVVRKEAHVALNHASLTGALYLQGYTKAQFVS